QKELMRVFPSLFGLRVFEIHPGGTAAGYPSDDYSHGLHIHLVTHLWMDAAKVQAISRRCGWGNADVHLGDDATRTAAYMAKYLQKMGRERPPSLKRWRLWSAFGAKRGFDYTRVSD